MRALKEARKLAKASFEYFTTVEGKPNFPQAEVAYI
jgi:hypothetical protein